MVLPAHWVNLQAAGQLDPLDRGLVYGDGLFETLRYELGRYHLLLAHLQRLQRGCSILDISYPQDRIEEQLALTREYLGTAGCSSCSVRLLVTRGTADSGAKGRGYGGEHGAASVVLSVFPSPLPWRSHAPELTLRSCEYRLAVQPQLAGIKHCNRLDQVLAARELSRHGAQEGLLYDTLGNLISAVSSNVFLRIEGALVTPVLTGSGVAGTVREALMRTVAPRCGVSVSEQTLTAADLVRASEVFLSNSLQGLRSVVAVDNHKFAEPGVVGQLREAFYDWVEETA